MTSYNEVNGEYANENTHLLQDILRAEWRFDGIVITDWGVDNEGTGYLYGSSSGRCAETCRAAGGGKALCAGYRLIDTAAAYYNEEAVEKAVKESGISRDKIYLAPELTKDLVRSVRELIFSL